MCYSEKPIIYQFGQTELIASELEDLRMLEIKKGGEVVKKIHRLRRIGYSLFMVMLGALLTGNIPNWLKFMGLLTMYVWLMIYDFAMEKGFDDVKRTSKTDGESKQRLSQEREI